jgi:hypothetical protein
MNVTTYVAQHWKNKKTMKRMKWGKMKKQDKKKWG